MPPRKVAGAGKSVERPNKLYHGDNLDILTRYIADSAVDLIYLDPPFQSGKDYNLLFRRQDGSRSPALVRAFTDTWRWDSAARAAYDEALAVNARVGQVLEAFQRFIPETPMLAYMSMMSLRLIELHRVLKPTGSLYLHCDPTASHYLKIVLDSIFEPDGFANEIIWERTVPKSLMSLRLPSNHDVLLAYHKTQHSKWNQDAVFRKYKLDDLDDKTKKKYSLRDKEGRLYQLTSLLNPNPDRPNLTYEFLGVTRVWRWTKDRMKAAHESGLIMQKRPGSVPRLKRYLDEQRGKPLGDVWTDIPPVNSQAQEREGYPTQKPVALLKRIIELTTDAGDVVLDPFCGCGTTIQAAHDMHRRWIGIDIAQQAIEIIRGRLTKNFGEIVDATYELVREPQDLEGACALALQDRDQFEKWAMRLVGGNSDSKAKGSDRGIDGVIQFQDGPGAPIQKIVISVKSGHVTSRDIRDLNGTITREGAAIGVFVTLEPPSAPMRREAASAGFYQTTRAIIPDRFPRIQILTVADVLDGEMIKAPSGMARKGPRRAVSKQKEFSFGIVGKKESEL